MLAIKNNNGLIIMNLKIKLKNFFGKKMKFKVIVNLVMLIKVMLIIKIN